MTFTEAAVEVLRLVGRPLHYKKIAEIAVAKNLLSHVGKSPDMTMSSRLATMIKKDRGDEPIIKVKPGVFGLREFDADALALADSDMDIDIDALPDVEVAPPAAPEPAPTEEEPHKLPGSDVFPEEEDDDEPILGKLDEPGEKDGESGEEGSSRRGRRRRGKRRGSADGEPDRDANRDANRPAGRESNRPAGRDGGNRNRDRDRNRDRNRDQDRDRDRNRDRDRDRDRDRGRGRSRRGGRGREREKLDMDRAPEEGDLAGRELADAIEAALVTQRREPLSYGATAELLVRKKRLTGSGAALAPTIAAAVRADNLRHADGQPRFREVEGALALTEWYVPREVGRVAREMRNLTSEHRKLTRAAFLRELEQLPAAGFVELLATWLNAEGISSLRAVRRPGSSKTELHLAGTLTRGHEAVPLAIVVFRDGRDLDGERIVEVRGGLHHYGHASMAWVVSLGRARKRAREEVEVSGAAPVALFDGDVLAAAMASRGVGLKPVSAPVLAIDHDLLDALRGEPGRCVAEDDHSRRKRRQAEDEEAGEAPEAEGAAEGSEASADAPSGAEAGSEAASESGSDEDEQEGGPRKRRRRRRRGRGRGRDEGEAVAEDESAEAADADGEQAESTEEEGANEAEEPEVVEDDDAGDEDSGDDDEDSGDDDEDSGDDDEDSGDDDEDSDDDDEDSDDDDEDEVVEEDEDDFAEDGSNSEDE